MLKLCIAGVTGRMGSILVNEAFKQNFEIVGAVAASDDEGIKSSLKDLALCNSEIIVRDSSELKDAVYEADVYITFTTPESELSNLPLVANLGKRIVMGTTGFTTDQMETLRQIVSKKVPAVFEPNFSLGMNIFFKIANACSAFPKIYDFSIVEIHHSGKKDSPSGTAKKLGSIISDLRGYNKISVGRTSSNQRTPEELEISSLRLGGILGIHELLIAGPHEMMKINHTVFSREVFAQGALYAAEWISHQENPGVYSLADIIF
jgi:4-hydroxy-tetrahydrodipicolinate reductase